MGFHESVRSKGRTETRPICPNQMVPLYKGGEAKQPPRIWNPSILSKKHRAKMG